MRRGMSHADLEGSRRVQRGRPEESASAALATIALHYGLPLSLRDIRQLLGFELHNDMFHLLFACRRCGFDVVPLEGDFEHLPEVPRPNIVAFRRTRKPRCRLHGALRDRPGLGGDRKYGHGCTPTTQQGRLLQQMERRCRIDSSESK